MRLRLARHIRLLVGVAIALAAGGFLVAWLGLYNVAASRDHWGIVERILAFGLRHSVDARTGGITVPSLDDPAKIRLGAAHFHAGCAYCHGAPGVPITPIARAMLPDPPDLADISRKWTAAELFWIVRHGIKYTGMPAWPADGRDDEVWSVVAFLQELPALDPDGYAALALGGMTVRQPDGRAIAAADPAAMIGACARCHGAEGRGPASALVPTLHGQPAPFLLDALRAYAAGTRPSGIMQPAATALPPDAMQRVADYYAGLARPAAPPAARVTADAAAIERGRRLAAEGAPGSRVPACSGCHGTGALAYYPRLAGQNQAYMQSQLRLWRDGPAPRTATGAIMGPIARLLTDQQIADVSAYFASTPAVAERQP